MKRQIVSPQLMAGISGVLLAAAAPACAAPAVAQAVGVSNAIVDEFGARLTGTERCAEQFGVPAVEGDLVQVLLATDNTVYPPHANGEPDPRNVVLMTTRIGRGVSPNLKCPARFATTISPRPGGNSRIFVRVFNAPTLGEASFYGDSQLFQVKSWVNEVFLADVTATAMALDTGDADDDGLNNSLEKSYGSDPHAADTDGDGYSDAEEVASGTDPLDRQSLFAVADVRVVRGSQVLLKWAGTKGVTYRVEHSSDLCGNAPFAPVATVTAENDLCEVSLPAAVERVTGCYRLIAVR